MTRVPTNGPIPHLWDTELRAQLLLAASQGMQRRQVAAVCRISRATLESWISRGKAHPEIEPWGSFARDYERASMSIQACGFASLSQQFTSLYKRLQASVEAGVGPSRGDQRMLEMLVPVMRALYPDMVGDSPHRVVEPELTGAEWLEAHPLEIDQVRAIMRDPPESIEQGMLAEADIVVARLLASGWLPAEAIPSRSEAGVASEASAEATSGTRGGSVEDAQT